VSRTPQACQPGRRRTILLGLIAAATLVNVVQFPMIERDAPEHWRAISRYESGDLPDIALRLANPSNVRERFGLALALAEVAPGSALVMASSLRMTHSRARGVLMSLGRVTTIEDPDYDPQSFFGDFDPRPFIVAQGEGGRLGDPYAIAVAEGAPERFVLLQRELSNGDLVDVLVDERLLPPGALDGLGT